jgi:DNA-binding CsgD family transcriptional regulator
MITRARPARRAGSRDPHSQEILAALRRGAAGDGGVVLCELAGTNATIDPKPLGAHGGPSPVRLLRAAGRASESAYPFGVAMQLFDDLWLEKAASSHFSGAGHVAAQLISGELKLDRLEQPTEAFPVVRSLTAVVLSLARHRDNDAAPVVLWVDSLHQVDASSLRFLAYLAPRVEQLPVAMILAGAAGGAYTDLSAIAEIRAHAVATRPPLGESPPASPPSPGQPGLSGGTGDAHDPTDRARVQATRTADHAGGAELAERAARAGQAGEHRRRVRELVAAAWEHEGGREFLLRRPEITAELLRGLLAVDELELAREILDDPRQIQAERAEPDAQGSACELRAWVLFHQGRILAAEEEAGRGLVDARAEDVRQSLQAVLAACLIHTGRLSDAEAQLDPLDGMAWHHARVVPLLLETRGQLRLAQRLASDALRDAMEARRRNSATDPLSSGPASWRVIAARANVALQRPVAARDLAARELELANARGVRRRRIAALRSLAAAAAPAAQVPLLERAVRLGDDGPSRLEHLLALADLGSALRRTNQRRAARVVLGRAHTLAEALGAPGACTRIQEELAATGGRRPRSVATGVEALTPSERRVAGLAAAGHSTRQIAGELFITAKTVEFHLHNIYRKLEIPSSREDLARTINEAGTGPRE